MSECECGGHGLILRERMDGYREVLRCKCPAGLRHPATLTYKGEREGDQPTSVAFPREREVNDPRARATGEKEE